MGEPKVDVLDRLRNPAWIHSHPSIGTVELDREQAVVDMKDGAAEIARLRADIATIADIAEGSTTANSLPHIAKIARGALAKEEPPEESVIELGPHERMTPKEALAFASREEWDHVIIAGYHMGDDDVAIRSSHVQREMALWISEQVRLHTLGLV